MFYIYTMHPDGDRVRYSMRQPIALFGAKIQGLIPRRLQASIGSGRNTPPAWRLSVAEELSQEGRHDAAVVIDIKPSSKREVKLVHLLDVWGYSDHGWTPVMLRARVLVDDEDPATCDKTNFLAVGGDEVFTFCYVEGSVNNGVLTRGWGLRGGGRTGGPLLSGRALRYFVEQIQAVKWTRA